MYRDSQEGAGGKSVCVCMCLHKFMCVHICYCRCGHCKRLAPEYESAATELSLDNPPVPLAKVDATVETSLANRFGINGYPTLKVFHQGTPYDYEGPRTAQGKAV